MMMGIVLNAPRRLGSGNDHRSLNPRDHDTAVDRSALLNMSRTRICTVAKPGLSGQLLLVVVGLYKDTAWL